MENINYYEYKILKRYIKKYNRKLGTYRFKNETKNNDRLTFVIGKVCSNLFYKNKNVDDLLDLSKFLINAAFIKSLFEKGLLKYDTENEDMIVENTFGAFDAFLKARVEYRRELLFQISTCTTLVALITSIVFNIINI